MPPGVLLVDDDEDDRALLATTLRREGIPLAGAASSGLEALELVTAEDVGVVVVDQLMPGLDGVETARRIRAIRPEVPLVLCTGQLTDRLQSEAAAAGVAVCLHKRELPLLSQVLRRLLSETPPGTPP